MKKEIECKVTGKVQMVMYRDFAQRNARGLNLQGFVENLPDGSVRVVAQGLEESLEEYVVRLHKGPFMARVMRVDVTWRDPEEDYREFKIIY